MFACLFLLHWAFSSPFAKDKMIRGSISALERYVKWVSLLLLPMIVQTIIALVNGQLGAGIAVAGAFSLVRFRSAPASAREITSIFLAMAVGLATGMGYIAIAVILAVFVILVDIALASINFGKAGSAERDLKIVIQIGRASCRERV